nr:E3 ubiquitin-protein ligase Hakai-like [Penaeus vannamei]
MPRSPWTRAAGPTRIWTPSDRRCGRSAAIGPRLPSGSRARPRGSARASTSISKRSTSLTRSWRSTVRREARETDPHGDGRGGERVVHVQLRRGPPAGPAHGPRLGHHLGALTWPRAPNNIDEKREAAGPGEGLMKEPPPPVAPQPPSVREDYDSSATASADEGQSGAGRDSPEVQHIPHPGERKPQHPPAHAKPSPTPPTNIVQNPDPSNVRDLIYIAIEKSLEDPCSSNVNSKDPPTIESILKASNFGRGQPPQPLAAPARRDFHREQRLHTPGRYNDPRDGLPPSDASTFDTQDTQCEGLDLSVRKRDRSPPPKQPPAHHAHPTHFHHPPQPHQPHQSHQPPPPPAGRPLSRDLPLTVRGGAELTITNKEPPPQAHSNSTPSYSKPPSHEPWAYADPRNKSPSAFISDARALPHPASSIMTNVAPSGAQPLCTPRTCARSTRSPPRASPAWRRRRR